MPTTLDIFDTLTYQTITFHYTLKVLNQNTLKAMTGILLETQIPKYEHVYIKLTCVYINYQMFNYYMTHDQNDDVNSEIAYLPFGMENTVNISLLQTY